jgi:hypothetical protein
MGSLAKLGTQSVNVGLQNKMIIIAEISDKMASIPKLWAIMAVFATPFLIGAVRRWVAWGLMPVAIALSGWIGYQAYHEAFVEAGMKEAIRDEMGWWWIINSISSTFLPILVATAVLLWTIRKRGNPTTGAKVAS